MNKSMKQLSKTSTALIFLVFACVVFFSSCKTPSDVVYLQDIQPNISIALQEAKSITMKPGDKL